MKAFEPKIGYDFTYPEDMEKIILYLQSKGTINVSFKKLEELYRDYCDEVWSAGWMDVDIPFSDGTSILDSFARWLSEVEY